MSILKFGFLFCVKMKTVLNLLSNLIMQLKIGFKKVSIILYKKKKKELPSFFLNFHCSSFKGKVQLG
jgi:hypothetical protein